MNRNISYSSLFEKAIIILLIIAFLLFILYPIIGLLLRSLTVGFTAKEWRDNNPNKDGNIRDYATIEELIVIANLESINAQLIADGLSQAKRLQKLNEIARTQLKSLLNNPSINRLKNNNNKKLT